MSRPTFRLWRLAMVRARTSWSTETAVSRTYVSRSPVLSLGDAELLVRLAGSFYRRARLSIACLRDKGAVLCVCVSFPLVHRLMRDLTFCRIVRLADFKLEGWYHEQAVRYAMGSGVEERGELMLLQGLLQVLYHTRRREGALLTLLSPIRHCVGSVPRRTSSAFAGRTAYRRRCPCAVPRDVPGC